MIQERQNFIDWLKAMGMFLIVFGHVFGQPFDILAPIYPKQLGVALFVFVMGWGLANDQRQGWDLFFARIFPMFLYGIVVAALYSLVAYGAKDNFALSNYLPFALGINVLLNHFPANPTTWYIGTYLHLLLLWLFFAGALRKGWPVVLVCLAIEIITRAAIMATGNLFIAYMTVFNWISIFALGVQWHGKKDSPGNWLLPVVAAGIVLFPLLWGNYAIRLAFDSSFPFMQMKEQEGLKAFLLCSFSVTLLYSGYTVLFFQLFRRIPAGGFVRFLSRNTLIIFLGHMPLIRAFHSSFYALFDNELMGRVSFILVLYLGLALVSECVNRNVALEKIRDGLWQVMKSRRTVKSNG